MRQSVRRGLLAALIGGATTAAASPATAGYALCNRTGFPVEAAIAYYDRGDWVSAGWYTIQGGRCLDLIFGRLDNQYYYVFAEQAGGPTVWNGDHYFCVSDNAFEIVGHRNCSRRGYYEEGFFEVDVGYSDHWTTDLVD